MATIDLPDDLIPTGKAAKILGVTTSCVTRWVVHCGKLRGWRVGGKLRVSEREVRAFARPVDNKLNRKDADEQEKKRLEEVKERLRRDHGIKC